MNKIAFLFLLALTIQCSSSKLFTNINIESPRSDSMTLGIKFIEDSVNIVGQENPIEICFNDSKNDNTYFSFLNTSLVRTLIGKTIFKNTILLGDSIQFVRQEQNNILYYKPLSPTTNVDFILVMNSFNVGYDPFYVQHVHTSRSGTEQYQNIDIGQKITRGRLYLNANVSLFNCSTKEVYKYGLIKYNKVVNNLNKFDLWALSDKIVEELFIKDNKLITPKK